jgi:Na+/H+ antiporter NhaD/arsenite permease-like protein
MMETIEYFSDFLRKIGAPNFLAIGIVIIVIWLLISGFRKGLKRRGRDKETQKNEENKNEDLSE